MDKSKPKRIAIVNSDRCKPNKCSQECKKSCPVVRIGKLCIEVTREDKNAFISEDLCIGCGICARECPFKAISIINLPKNIDIDTTHRYHANSFKLHRLPVPRTGNVLGLVGANGTGKSTALKILAGKLKLNLGEFQNPPDWKEIINHFRGSGLQNYFAKVAAGNFKALIKPQFVDQIPRAIQGRVGEHLQRKSERGNLEEICNSLDLMHLMDHQVENLSGGELQRFAIAMMCIQQADVYMFDEPSSYLDVKQRLKAAEVIRNLRTDEKYVIVVEHDLAILDYFSDYVVCLYGMPGVYGIITRPAGVREGINHYLDGYLPTENMRFREYALTFSVAEHAREEIQRDHQYTYGKMIKSLGTLDLTVQPGGFSDSEIVVMLGENGTGKTTFIRMLAGRLQPNEGNEVPELNVSYKPQIISPNFEGSVRQLFHRKITQAYIDPQFISDVIKPLGVQGLYDQEVQNLSGGEIQRVALTLCLGKPADVYLIDEPSAYLDSEQRLFAAKVIKRFILHSKKTAFVVEHDFIMATYLADRVIVFEGTPSQNTTANSPMGLQDGMNKFLASLGITIRRDLNNLRPRINKKNSVKDMEQKKSGNYFFLED